MSNLPDELTVDGSGPLYRAGKTAASSTALDSAKHVLALMEQAHFNNPYQSGVMASPPTVTVGSTSDAALTVYSLASAGAFLPAFNQVAWYGGLPTVYGNIYVGMPVTSIAPSTGANFTGSKNQWSWAAEFVTDSDKVQLTLYTSSSHKHFFQVDGKYVDLAGTLGNNATIADTVFTLQFASKKPRRIRVAMPTFPAKGPAMFKAIRVSPGCSFWKPDQSQVLRMGWFGDSYPEGTNAENSVYPIANAAWPVLTGELLGIRDVRQFVAGSTGYISTAGGVRPKLRDMIPLVADQGDMHIIVVSHGYNDSSNTAAAITAEAKLAYAALRKQYPNAIIIVLGCQAGSGAPTAAQIATENAIKDAVTQTGDKFMRFVPVSTDTPVWLSSANAALYVSSDNTHPNLAGHEYISFRSAPGIRGAVKDIIEKA